MAIYASNATFDGQRLSVGRTVLVFLAEQSRSTSGELAELRMWPATVEEIWRDSSGTEVFDFRLSDGRLIRSETLDGRGANAHGFVLHFEESIGLAEPRTWTFPPRV